MRFLCLPGAYGSSDVSEAVFQVHDTPKLTLSRSFKFSSVSTEKAVSNAVTFLHLFI